MKTILVPTDFSEAANNAVDYALMFAKATKAKILLFHAFHVPIIVSDVPLTTIDPTDLKAENDNHLRELAKTLSMKSGVEVNSLAKMGFAVDEILKEEGSAWLIIMGMRGASKLSEVLMGSITTTVLRKSKTPVLVIPENVVFKIPAKIVFACDYHPDTNPAALNALQEVVETFNSKIYVVNVKQKKESVKVEKIIDWKKEERLCDIEHIYYFPEKEDLADGINEFVHDHKGDMLALIPHQYGILEKLFHRSITKKIAFHTQVPMLALPDHRTAPSDLP